MLTEQSEHTEYGDAMINTTNGLLEVDPLDMFSKYLFHI